MPTVDDEQTPQSNGAACLSCFESFGRLAENGRWEEIGPESTIPDELRAARSTTPAKVIDRIRRNRSLRDCALQTWSKNDESQRSYAGFGRVVLVVTLHMCTFLGILNRCYERLVAFRQSLIDCCNWVLCNERMCRRTEQRRPGLHACDRSSSDCRTKLPSSPAPPLLSAHTQALHLSLPDLWHRSAYIPLVTAIAPSQSHHLTLRLERQHCYRLWTLRELR